MVCSSLFSTNNNFKMLSFVGALIWVNLLLFISSVYGIPTPEAIVAPLWRGIHGRTLAIMKQEGGLQARGLSRLQGRFPDMPARLTDEEKVLSVSLFEHARGTQAKYTQYVSTSINPEIAQEFASGGQPDELRYLFKTYPGSSAIDLNESIGTKSPFPHQQEFSVPGIVPWNRIEGWYEIPSGKTKILEIIGDDPTKFKVDPDIKFIKNPEFKEEFRLQKPGGPQPQLAGIPDNNKFYPKKYDPRLTKNFEEFVGKADLGGVTVYKGFSGAGQIPETPAPKKGAGDNKKGGGKGPGKGVDCRRKRGICDPSIPDEPTTGKPRVDIDPEPSRNGKIGGVKSVVLERFGGVTFNLAWMASNCMAIENLAPTFIMREARVSALSVQPMRVGSLVHGVKVIIDHMLISSQPATKSEPILPPPQQGKSLWEKILSLKDVPVLFWGSIQKLWSEDNVTAFKKSFEDLKKAFKEVPDAVKKGMTDLTSVDNLDAFKKSLGDLKTQVSQLPEAVKAGSKDLVDPENFAAFEKSLGDLGQAVGEIPEAVKSGAEDLAQAPGDIANAFLKAPQQLANALQDFSREFNKYPGSNRRKIFDSLLASVPVGQAPLKTYAQRIGMSIEDITALGSVACLEMKAAKQAPKLKPKRQTSLDNITASKVAQACEQAKFGIITQSCLEVLIPNFAGV
ncbi:hypothetical protein Dda_1195 [Drechslerella dactyloides]|uniref:Uncharacterized protein n=1 Tax=Drechslerella dactyloides TaxID=74499 RepID=A0AAD6J688_DREDA|nr:hypothetical protein Dda_1195 [Drechslerella dactyloides]